MPDTDPAALLREAAALMRDRAAAATPGRWREMHLGSEGCIVLNDGRLRDRKRVAMFGAKEWKADHADAEYVAGMQPAVALAVADWLDVAATCGCEEGDDHWQDKSAALAVARVYLGRDDA